MEEELLRFNKTAKYVILDVETENLCLNWQNNKCWQLSTLEFQGDKAGRSQDIRIAWPNLKVSKGAAEITHFNLEEHNKLAISPEEAFNKFHNLLKESDHIMGHNFIKFDIYLLKGYYEFMGVDWKFIVPKIIDTNAISRGIKLGIPFNKSQESFIEYQFRMANAWAKGVKTRLEVLGKEYGIEYDYNNLHNASVDVYLNFLVWQRLKFQIEY